MTVHAEYSLLASGSGSKTNLVDLCLSYYIARSDPNAIVGPVAKWVLLTSLTNGAAGVTPQLPHPRIPDTRFLLPGDLRTLGPKGA